MRYSTEFRVYTYEFHVVGTVGEDLKCIIRFSALLLTLVYYFLVK